MKIYIVTDGDYSDYHIEAVFTSKENAEKFAALHGLDGVEEWDADEPQIDGVWYCFDFEIWGDALHCEKRYFTNRKVELVQTYSFTREPRVCVSLKEPNEEKAKKIAQDIYAQWKYEQIEKGGEKK